MVLWGKDKEMSGLAASGEIKTQNSLEIIVASSNDGGLISDTNETDRK